MKVVFSTGIYDLFHKGHINLLNEMREFGDLVVCIIHDDQSCYDIKGKFPVQPLELRILSLIRSELIDGIIICRGKDPANEFKKVLSRYKGNELVYMRGNDLTDNFPGKWFLDENNVPIEFVKYTEGISSSILVDLLR